jgi:Leucine-rich repeat (LRR) protein
LLAGIWRAVILLPREMAFSGETSELSAVLVHELTHLYNRDLVWMAFLRGLAVVFWWHPLAWLLCRAHAQACEEACDTAAAEFVGDSAAYSRTLARMALSAITPARALAGVPMARRSQIGRRLARLARPGDAPCPGFAGTALVVILGAASAIGLSALQFVSSAASTAPASAPARVLHFPRDRSLGTVWIWKANQRREIKTFYYWSEDGVSEGREALGEARGDVSIPAGHRVQLMISHDGWKDLSPLANLAPDDIDELVVAGTGLSREAAEERGFFRTDSAGDEIMPHVARLTGLKSLDLHTTEVTGSGLRHIEGLKSLECLSVPRSMNDGGMVHIAKLTGLKRLYFKENNVTNKGLARLAELRELEELELGGGKISDGGLAHLRKLPKLQYLMLWGGSFTDAGMAYVKEIRSLRIFWPFRINTIGDQGLAYLAGLPNLERLNLCYNDKITDLGMAHVARMKSLRQLDISSTNIGDVGAEHLRQLRDLELLELPDGISRSAVADLLATKPRLRSLSCGNSSNCTYGDEVLEQVGRMADIEKLNISGISVTDSGVAHLTRCTRLKDVSLFACPITNKGLAEFGKITSLERLYLHKARLTTSGLKQLNGLSRLEWLYLSDVMPDEGFIDISGLTSLRHLTLGPPYKGPYLRDDDLACLAKLTNLEWLQMSWGDGITDEGLAHLADLTRLERISIGGKGVTDKGLACLSGMKRLDNLTIQGNFTSKGLLQLEQNPSLAVLFLVCPEQPDQATVKRLMQNLPQLGFLSYGPDLQKMRPIGTGRASSAGFGMGGLRQR